MGRTAAEFTGEPVGIVPISPAEWVLAVSGSGWSRILRKLDRTVREVVDAAGGERVRMVGHSAGGVMGRLYLSPDPFRGDTFDGAASVSRLITLGSPHHNVRGAPLRRWVDRTLPGAFFSPRVSYTAVAGRLVRGNAAGGLLERAVSMVYQHICGSGEVWGDGLVPVSSALLDGASHVVLPGVGHAPFRGHRWYGTAEVVKEWWEAAEGRAE